MTVTWGEDCVSSVTSNTSTGTGVSVAVLLALREPTTTTFSNSSPACNVTSNVLPVTVTSWVLKPTYEKTKISPVLASME